MVGPIRFETVTDGLVALGIGLMLIAVYGSWLAVYRTARAAPQGSSPWFRMPVWGQIAAGIALSLVGASVCIALWRPIPLAVSDGLALALRLIGLPLIGAGVGLWFWSRRTLGAMLGRARREEEALAATFGDVWREYAARVPRFVPRWRK